MGRLAQMKINHNRRKQMLVFNEWENLENQGKKLLQKSRELSNSNLTQYDSGSRSWTLGHGWNTSALTSMLGSSWTYEVSPFLSSVHVWACYESNFNERKSAWLSFGLSWLIVSAQFHCAIFAINNISLVLRKKCYMKCGVWNQMIYDIYDIPFTGKHEPKTNWPALNCVTS